MRSEQIEKDKHISPQAGNGQFPSVLNGRLGPRARKNAVANTCYAYRLVVEACLSIESFISPWRANLLKTGLICPVLLVGIGGFGTLALKQLRARIAMEDEIQCAD